MASFASLATAATSLSNLILVTPNTQQGIQPQNLPNPTGAIYTRPKPILFNYEGEQTVTLQSDITDHYVEDNKTRQDSIALRPEIITTSGYIGELNDIQENAFLNVLQQAATRLLTVSAYTPKLSATALIKYNQAAFAASVITHAASQAVGAWNFVKSGGKSGPAQTKQQAAFGLFYGYWQKRVLFTVQTPWTIFPNCAIQTLRAVQDPDTRMITNFEVTFKVLKFSKTIVTKVNAKTAVGRALERGSVDNLGTSSPGSSVAFATSGVA